MIDTRERHLFSSLERHVAASGHFSKIQQLIRGDYAIAQGTKVHAVIERKTLKDLASSIKDGRLENLTGLTEMRDKYACQVWLLIEGQPFHAAKQTFGRISWATLESCILDASIRRGIFLMWTRNKDDTARKLCKLVDRYIRADELTAVTGGIDALSCKREVNDVELVARMWAAIPGITAQTGFEFAKLGSFVALQALSDKALRDIMKTVKYGSGRCMSVKTLNYAFKFLRGTDSRDVTKKILTVVPRISPKTAAQIASEYHFIELLKYDSNTLINLKPANIKNKLGKSGELLFKLMHTTKNK